MAISEASYQALRTRRDTVIARINGWTEGDMGDKANANTPGAADHVKYKESLYKELEYLDNRISNYENELNGGDVYSEGVT